MRERMYSSQLCPRVSEGWWKREGWNRVVSYTAEEMPHKNNQDSFAWFALPAFRFVERFEGDFVALLILELDFAGASERLG